MRNYRSISSPDSWTYIYSKNIFHGLDADKPNLIDGVLFSFEGYAQGLGYRVSDDTLWGVGNTTLTKYSTSGVLLDSWNLYGSSNGAEIDGDNDDFIWVTTRFDAIAKYSLSARTDIAEVTYFSMGKIDGVNHSVNGICAPAGDFVYYGITGSSPALRKIRKVDGVIVATYNLINEPSGLAWDGVNIWVSYSGVAAIDCFNPNDFTLVKTFNSPYPNNQGLTYDGQNFWVSYPTGNIIAKLGSSTSSPANLYYATDTEKFYWNVEGNWKEVSKGADNFLAFVDSPDSYAGQAGKIVVVNSTENGLEFITPAPPPPQTAVVSSIAKSGSAAMTGDIIFEAGANVTLTEDEATKKIIIAAAALEPPPQTEGVTSIAKSGSAAMTGDILLEAGANVTLTEDTTTKKIIIAAAAADSTDAISIHEKPIPMPLVGDDEKVLAYDNDTMSMKWVTQGAAGSNASSINGIPVDTDSQIDGYVLTYDVLTGKILLKPKPTGGGDTAKSYSISGVRVFNGLAGSWLNNYTISGVNSTPSPNP